MLLGRFFELMLVLSFMLVINREVNLHSYPLSRGIATFLLTVVAML